MHLSSTRIGKNNTNISECPDAYARWYCLNGATCFAVKIHEATLYNCWCTSGFHGLRCDYKYVTHHYQEESTGPSLMGSQNGLHAAISSKQNTKTAEFAGEPVRILDRRVYLMIVYNLLALLLLVLLTVLLLRCIRRRAVPVEATMADIVARAFQVSQERQKNEQINHDSVSIRLDITEERQPEQEEEQWHQQHLYHESCLTASTARYSCDQHRAARQQPIACQPQQQQPPWRQQNHHHHQQQPHQQQQQQKPWIHSQMVPKGDHQQRRKPV